MFPVWTIPTKFFHQVRKTLGEIERLLVKLKSSRWNSWNLAEMPSHLVKLHKVIGYLLHSVRALSSLWTFTFIPFENFHVLNHQLSPHGPSTLIPWAVCFHNLNRPLSPVRPSTLFFNPFTFWTIVHFLMDPPLYLRTSDIRRESSLTEGPSFPPTSRF